jgi:Fe-S cluster biogenesis protein NfuA
VENKRLGDLDKIAADYAKLLAAERDELVAKVTTAVVRTARARVAAGGGRRRPLGTERGRGGAPVASLRGRCTACFVRAGVRPGAQNRALSAPLPPYARRL